jgi:hypothetical protein
LYALSAKTTVFFSTFSPNLPEDLPAQLSFSLLCGMGFLYLPHYEPRDHVLAPLDTVMSSLSASLQSGAKLQKGMKENVGAVLY